MPTTSLQSQHPKIEVDAVAHTTVSVTNGVGVQARGELGLEGDLNDLLPNSEALRKAAELSKRDDFTPYMLARLPSLTSKSGVFAITLMGLKRGPLHGELDVVA